jgi:nucleoside-diphosphate-sugar epimerase
MSSTYLITGATGFIGSHLAEACLERGLAVRTIARPSSDTKRLDELGVAVLRGDLTDTSLVQRAVEGVDAVIHCAAKVGEWGPLSDYRLINVDATRALVEACHGRSLKRFVHMSSLGVYSYGHHYGTDETTPPPKKHIDGYTQTKVEAEQILLDAHKSSGLPVVVLRPGFVYGEREPKVLPKMLDALKNRRYAWIGSGNQLLNCIYVGNVVQATFLALENDKAVGQVFNLTDGEAVSRRRFIGAMVKTFGFAEPVTSIFPLWFAPAVAAIVEDFARMIGTKEPPFATRFRLKLLGLNLDFSVEKARRELGYQPRFGFDQGMERTLAWYKQQSAQESGVRSQESGLLSPDP